MASKHASPFGRCVDNPGMSSAPTTPHTSSPRPVLIAGGGIGGMATALTLHQIGVPCIVFESLLMAA